MVHSLLLNCPLSADEIRLKLSELASAKGWGAILDNHRKPFKINRAWLGERAAKVGSLFEQAKAPTGEWRYRSRAAGPKAPPGLSSAPPGLSSRAAAPLNTSSVALLPPPGLVVRPPGLVIGDVQANKEAWRPAGNRAQPSGPPGINQNQPAGGSAAAAISLVTPKQPKRPGAQPATERSPVDLTGRGGAQRGEGSSSAVQVRFKVGDCVVLKGGGGGGGGNRGRMEGHLQKREVGECVEVGQHSSTCRVRSPCGALTWYRAENLQLVKEPFHPLAQCVSWAMSQQQISCDLRLAAAEENEALARQELGQERAGRKTADALLSQSLRQLDTAMARLEAKEEPLQTKTGQGGGAGEANERRGKDSATLLLHHETRGTAATTGGAVCHVSVQTAAADSTAKDEASNNRRRNKWDEAPSSDEQQRWHQDLLKRLAVSEARCTELEKRPRELSALLSVSQARCTELEQLRVVGVEAAAAEVASAMQTARGAAMASAVLQRQHKLDARALKEVRSEHAATLALLEAKGKQGDADALQLLSLQAKLSDSEGKGEAARKAEAEAVTASKKAETTTLKALIEKRMSESLRAKAMELAETASADASRWQTELKTFAKTSEALNSARGADHEGKLAAEREKVSRVMSLGSNFANNLLEVFHTMVREHVVDTEQQTQLRCFSARYVQEFLEEVALGCQEPTSD